MKRMKWILMGRIVKLDDLVNQLADAVSKKYRKYSQVILQDTR
jgi:hypothetical protein